MLKPSRRLLAGSLLMLAPGLIQAAPLAVSLKAVEGEVRHLEGAEVRAAAPGDGFEPGSQLRTGADGRARLAGKSLADLSLGASTEVLLHSGEGNVLRARLSRGAIRVDARAGKGYRAGDLRLNVGDIKLRVVDAAVWAEYGADQVQVCLLRGAAELQLPDRTGRLEIPGQCVRHSGVESSWAMVPIEVLDARIAAISMSAPVVAAAAPAPAPAPVVVAPEPPAPPAAPEAKPEPAPAGVIAAAEPAAPPPPSEPAAPAAEPAPPAAPEPSPPVVAVVPEPAPPVAASPEPPTPPSAEPVAVVAAPEALPVPVPVPPAEPVVESLVVPSAETSPSAEVAVAAAAEPAPEATPPELRRWSVVLASFPDRTVADQAAQRLRAPGIEPEVRYFANGERRGYRIGIGRHDTREQAEAALAALQAQHPKLSGWVAKY